MEAIKAELHEGEAMTNTAAPVSGQNGGTEEEFWSRCWNRKRELSERISDLAEMGCTMEEISAALDVPEEYLRARFRRELRRGLARFRARLRRSLLCSAEGGKVPVQMWLGQSLLGGFEESRPTESLCDVRDAESLEEWQDERGREGG